MRYDDFSCDPRKWSPERLYKDRSGFEAVRLEKERRDNEVVEELVDQPEELSYPSRNSNESGDRP